MAEILSKKMQFSHNQELQHYLQIKNIHLFLDRSLVLSNRKTPALSPLCYVTTCTTSPYLPRKHQTGKHVH